jgi:Second Messenger Oligonucleotide or Dinucleotide Synthetase domain
MVCKLQFTDHLIDPSFADTVPGKPGGRLFSVYTLGTHFDVLLQNILPPQERLDAACTLPPLVRDFLKEHEEFTTLYPHSRLAGSYAQDMSACDVKDVDFLVRVPGDPEKNEPAAKALIQSLCNVLNDLPAALGYEGWAGVDIERARRSVHVYFKGHDFHLDVVPCIAPDGFDEPLYVPDRGFNEWIESHPIGYINLLNDLNNVHSKKVKPLGRLFKHFRNQQMKARKPKSYWLGALLVHHIQKENGLDMTQPLAVLFRDLLDGVYNQYRVVLDTSDTATPHIKDPLLGHDISWNWSRGHFETFMRRLDDGRTWATKALETDDREKAIGLWQKIFGEDYFPVSVDEKAAQLAAAGLPGKSYVTGSGLIVPAQTAATRLTVTQPTTFHGSEAE